MRRNKTEIDPRSSWLDRTHSDAVNGHDVSEQTKVLYSTINGRCLGHDKTYMEILHAGLPRYWTVSHANDAPSMYDGYYS